MPRRRELRIDNDFTKPNWRLAVPFKVGLSEGNNALIVGDDAKVTKAAKRPSATAVPAAKTAKGEGKRARSAA
jgi:hypothetical protein